jgi:hypothetical protein
LLTLFGGSTTQITVMWQRWLKSGSAWDPEAVNFNRHGGVVMRLAADSRAEKAARDRDEIRRLGARV